MLSELQTLLGRLEAAGRKHQRETAAVLLLRTVKYFCGIFIGLFVLDVALHLDAHWRCGLLLAVLGGALALAAIGWHLGFIRRRRAEHTARLLESRSPALGSRLINLLQLSAQADDRELAPLTRELARQAVESYAQELQGIPFEKLAHTDAVRRHAKRAAAALFLFAGVLALAFRISAVELARYLDPFGDHPPYSFTRLEIVQPGPAGTNVLYDKGTVVRVQASGHRPREVYLTSFPRDHREQAVTVPMFDKPGAGYDQLLDHLRAETIAFAHTRDHVSESKQVVIGVTLTPQMEHLLIRTAPPAYTGIAPSEHPFAFKPIQALEGSEVQFRLRSNRPLREGMMEVTAGDQPPQRVPLRKSAETEVSGTLVARDSGLLRFSITDADGIPSETNYEAALTVTHDLPPDVRLAAPERDCFVAIDFKLRAVIEADDDYGLGLVRLQSGVNEVFGEPAVFSFTNIVRNTRQTGELNFSELGVHPGDTLVLFAEAIDNAPEPHLARSQTVRVGVISVEDYNDFLREQNDITDAAAKYAELIDDLRALMDAQRQLGKDIETLRESVSKAPPNVQDSKLSQLDGLVARQNELNQKLNEQAGRMEHFVRDNPLYDIESELQEILRQQAGSIRQSTATNAASTLDVAMRSAPADGPRQLTPQLLTDFKQASDDQLARLGGTREDADQQVVQKLDDLGQMQELLNDFNLFESLYRSQQQIAEQSKAYNRAGQLNREDQLALKELAGRQKTISNMLELLEDKLRQDAAAAETLFPKASRSGRDLADEIGRRRLSPLADQTTDRMLSGSGDQSSELAERLRGEMEQMFSNCQGGNCPSGSELDAYLRLQRMSSGRTFAQMARSRKFGLGAGRGGMGNQGEGQMGASGYAIGDARQIAVHGNESRARNSSRTQRQSERNVQGAGLLAATAAGETAKPGSPDGGLNPINRLSAAVSAESAFQEYNNVVESYFRAITAEHTTAEPGKPASK